MSSFKQIMFIIRMMFVKQQNQTNFSAMRMDYLAYHRAAHPLLPLRLFVCFQEGLLCCY